MIQETIQNRLINSLVKKREQQIIDRLAEMGYTFSNADEKIRFAKDRLVLVTYEEKPHEKHLFIDGKIPVCWWSDEIKIGWNENALTATCG